MKKYYKKASFYCYYWQIILFLFLFSNAILAQDNNQNWVKQIVYKTQTATPIATPLVSQAQVSLTYLDGLGRPLQQVANQMSNDGKDIVTYIEYDSFGRQAKQYLPYVATTSTMAYDSTLFGATSLITNYLNNTYPNFSGQNLYTETQFDNSPLNRVLKQAAPGTDWAMGSGKEVKFDYQANTLLGDKVRQFSFTGMTGTLTETTNYADNTLYKTVVYDENTSLLTPKGGIEEFKNIRGQVVLKRTYAIDNGNNFATAHDTYNVYDEFDNLRYVISPKAADIATITPQIILDLCYTYKYDYRNRLIEKKEPGKQWEFIVYDELNRIVATGPATNPFGGLETETGWLRTYYDNLNRVCYTGWTPQTLIISPTRATLQNSFTGIAVANVAKTTTGSIDGKIVYYNNLSPANLKLLTVNYYDNYNFPDAPTVFTSTLPNQTVHYNNTNRLPKGLPTGSWTRALTTTILAGETAYILYDYRARPIETKNTNHLNGFTRTQTKLDFSGKIEYNLTSHSLNTQTATLTTKDVFTYSNQDRMLLHTNQVMPSGVIEVLTNNTYNNMGQLLNKKVGGTTLLPLQIVDYTYNVRGWLKGINDVGGDSILNPYPLIKTGDPNDLFAFRINHNDGVAGPQYNGNISETLWRSSNDNILRKYNYQFDAINRMTSAVYSKPQIASHTNNYGESASYDQNGNILSMVRFGNYDTNGGSLKIDDLQYRYKTNTNMLEMVYDATNSTAGFKDNATATSNDPADYAYDLSGNLTRDNNKTIQLIKYNHLNLPTEIIFANTATKINYLYNAAGKKLQKMVQTSATLRRTTDYLVGFQYTKANAGVARLQFFPTSEGYVSVSGTTFNYVYNYLDHLGNVRLSYSRDQTTQTTRILEENNYYPYGLKHTNYNADLSAYVLLPAGTIPVIKPVISGGGTTANAVTVNNYKYNGKELQSELDLNLYDMDMRDYDPAIARWTGIDPVTHFSQSPYQFGNNNPIFFSDPSGMDGEPINTWHYAGAGASGGHGNFSAGDHMFGGSGDSFWMGQGATTWGGGSPISMTGNTININWSAFGDTRTVWNASTNVISRWIPGPGGVIYDGDPSVNRLDSAVVNGHWERSGGWDIANGVAGNYLSALDSYASANADKVYKYGTRTVSAVALTEANAARMLGISRVAQGIGGTLAIGTGAYGLYSERQSYLNTGTYNGQAVVDSSISIAGGVSGSLLLAAEVGLLILSPALVPILTVVAVGATAYGVYTLGRDIYNANH